MSFRVTAIVNHKMPGTKKILITTESHERFILSLIGGGRAFGICQACAREVELITVDQAVSLCGTKTGEIVRLALAGEIHWIETDSGHMLFCKESATGLAKKEEDDDK